MNVFSDQRGHDSLYEFYYDADGADDTYDTCHGLHQDVHQNHSRDIAQQPFRRIFRESSQKFSQKPHWPIQHLQRLAPYIAARYPLSRRQAEDCIRNGHVSLNGAVVSQFALPVQELEKGHIIIQGVSLKASPDEPKIWLYYKPLHQVVTWRDPLGRETVFQQVRQHIPNGPLFSVGRLDYMSQGLLLFTNTASIAHNLEKNPWSRTYHVWVHGPLHHVPWRILGAGMCWKGVEYGSCHIRRWHPGDTLGSGNGHGGHWRLLTKDHGAPLKIAQGALKTQREGNFSGGNIDPIALAGKLYGPRIFSPNQGLLSITVREGKNREIRRLMGSVGLSVERLLRIAYGPFSLGTMTPLQVISAPQSTLESLVSRVGRS